jgi:hypothetical protein
VELAALVLDPLDEAEAGADVRDDDDSNDNDVNDDDSFDALLISAGFG